MRRNGENMRILLYKWKVYTQYDIVIELKKMGHEVDLFERKLRNHNEDAQFSQELSELVIDKKYDLVFSVNYFGAVSDACKICGIKYVVWTCDSPLISMHHESVFNDCNYIFIFDKVNYYTFKAMGVKNLFYMPLAVNTNRLDQLLEEADDLEKYNSDISFVGSMYDKNSYDESREKLSDYLRGYFDAAMMAQIDIFGDNIIDKLLTPNILYELGTNIEFSQDSRSFSDLALVFSTTFLGFKMASMERRTCLGELGKTHQVDLYTDTKQVNIAGVNNIGSVDYHKDMPKVFHQSKINLNFTIRNIRSGIPLRVWDVLGSGGFMLTNFQAELPTYFENGKDLVYFESIEDLLRKADYYMSHEEERKQIAINGNEKVRKYHSYESRITQILATIK